ncbi:mannose-1-phosphate guanyltransferase [Bacillaceae bacterium]
MKAVIMAGGKGTRLRPLTSNTPKPMVPLLNKPCMEYSIELLKKYGITEIAVTLQYLPHVIKNYFGDGSEFGVRIEYFEETVPLGTAGSVKNAEDFLGERFIVISGDALTDFHLDEAIRYHEEKGALATLVMKKVDHPLEYGVVMTNDNGEVVRFLEKPSWSEVFSDTVNTGIYIFEPEIFAYYEKGIEYDFSKDLFPLLLKEKKPLYGYTAKGYWSDIGNLQMYRQTQFDMLDGRVNVAIQGTEILPRVFVENPVKIDPQVKIEGPAFIGENCTIAEGVKIGAYSVIGRNNVLQKEVLLQKTILWENNFIDKKAELYGATVCAHSQIGECATLFEGAVLGDRCKVGAKAFIKQGVKVWPQKEIEENSTVHTSLVWGVKLAKSRFGNQGIRGVANVEITPDFASQLAAAYGYIMRPGANVALSSCSHPFARLIKQSLMTGLHSAGIDTTDFGTMISAATRYGVKAMGHDGGIHVLMEEPLGDKGVLIEFYDQDGIPVHPSFARKIENAFWQEDYVRTNSEMIGSNKFFPQMEDAYIEGIMKEIRLDAIRRDRFKVVMEYDYKNLNKFVIPIMDRLGCKVISVSSEDTRKIGDLIQLVKRNRADLGITMDKNGQEFTFITEKGNLIEKDLLFGLQLLINCHNRENYVLGVPVSAPSVLERMAKDLNGKVVRTKETPRAMMEVAKEERFHPMFDALYTLVKVMEYMALRHTTLSEMCESIPNFHIVRKAVFCPWTEKGKVMRLIMEEMKGKDVELLDGIKVYDSQGWVLILPDMEGPSFKVITQAASEEVAVSLADAYAQRIKFFQTT